ncbi:unnamed protein product [Mytilus edulis]|uniref:Uncharacterized protein n=1 Tax=Mytilus edulis TaxID=6550 RepID=A0A8S3TN43_MYTED|nr:unnamed protein product [Mytilus edulis]
MFEARHVHFLPIFTSQGSIYDADSKTKPDDDDRTKNVGQLIETIKTILEIKNDIQRAYENVAKNKKSTGKDDEDCIEIEPGTNPNNSKPITSNNANHSLPFKYSETVEKSPTGNADLTKSTGVEIYDILSKKHNSNDRNSLKIKKAGKKITVNKNIKKSGKTTEDATRKILFFQRNKSVKINLPKKVQPTSSKPSNKDSKQPKDSLTPTETDDSQPSSAKVHSEIIHDVKNEAVLLKSESLSETPTDRVIMPINSQPTINILKTDTVLPKTTKSVSETAKSERKTSKSKANSMAQRNVTRNTVSVKPKTTVPKKSSKGSVTTLDDLNSSNSDIILPKTSGPVNKINVISKSTLSSTKQNGIMDGGQKKNIISSGSSATSQPKTSHGRKPELHSHTEPSITVSKPTIANEVLNIIPPHDDENPQSISRNSKLITGIKVGGNTRLLRKNDFSYTNKLTSQQKGLSVINEPVTISKSMSNPSDENQSSSNKELSIKGVLGTTTLSSPLPVSNDRIHTTKNTDEQTQTEINNDNPVTSVTQTDSPIKNSNTKRTLESTIVSVKKIKKNLKTTDGKHDDKIFGKGLVTDEDKSNTKPKSPLVNKDPLNENVGEDTKIFVVGQLSPSIITGNGRLATKAVESGQLSMPHGLSNSNAFVVNSGPRFVNNHVSMEKINRKQTIDGLNKGQKIVNKLSNSDMPSNDDQSSINIITTDYISKTGNLQVSKETTVQPEHNTVPGSIVTGSLGIDQVVARNTLSARPTFVSVVPSPPKSHLSNFIEKNFDDQAVNGKRVQSINTLNVSPNEKTNFDDQAVNGNRVQDINALDVSPNEKTNFDDQAVNGNRVQTVYGNRVQNIKTLNGSPNEKKNFDDQAVNGNRVQNINALDVSPNEKPNFDDQAVYGNRVQNINALNVSPNEKTNFDDQAVNGNRVQSINTLNVSPNEKTNFDDQAVYGNRVQNIKTLNGSPNEKKNFDDQAVNGNRVQNINALDVSTKEKPNFDDQAVYGNRVQNINALNVSPNENTNIGNSITLNLKVHSDGENSIHNTFDNNVNSDLFKSGVSVKSLSTDAPVSSNTDGSLFVVTASLQSTQTKVQKAKSNEDKNLWARLLFQTNKWLVLYQ